MKLLDLSSLYKYTPELLEYYHILSPEIPEFILEYSNTQGMLKQQYISVSCGTIYSKLYDLGRFSSLEHSIWVALIIRNFTKDKKQSLAWLFHDIATPVFKHSIDYMHWDYHNQESTEDLTTEILKNSKEINNLLERDNIKINEINDYKIYTIADNKTPQLSADRLEYTLSNNLFVYKNPSPIEEIKEIYNNIIILENEKWEKELWFNNTKQAEKFTKIMSELSILYMIDKTRFSMQFLADLLKTMYENNEIKIEDLYSLKESEIIEKIKTSKTWNVSKCYNIRENAKNIRILNEEPKNTYFVHHWTKIRYIDPLVKEENKRISNISSTSKENINKCLNFNMDNYMTLNFKIFKE